MESHRFMVAKSQVNGCQIIGYQPINIWFNTKKHSVYESNEQAEARGLCRSECQEPKFTIIFEKENNLSGGK